VLALIGFRPPRVLLVKGVREHFVEHDSKYEQFSVDTETVKTATVVPDKK
jgi:hypothetical protein